MPSTGAPRRKEGGRTVSSFDCFVTGLLTVCLLAETLIIPIDLLIALVQRRFKSSRVFGPDPDEPSFYALDYSFSHPLKEPAPDLKMPSQAQIRKAPEHQQRSLSRQTAGDGTGRRQARLALRCRGEKQTRRHIEGNLNKPVSSRRKKRRSEQTCGFGEQSKPKRRPIKAQLPKKLR